MAPVATIRLSQGRICRVKKSTNLVLLLCLIPLTAHAQSGSRPYPPTEASCRAYQQAAWGRLSQIYREIQTCHQRHSRVDYGRHCDTLRRTVVTKVVGWADCDGWEEEICAMQSQVHDGYSCLQEARKQEDRERAARQQAEREREATIRARENAIKQYNDTERRVRDLQSTYSDLRAAWNDPKRFVVERLARRVNDSVLAELYNRNGEFTARGRSSMQETYDFLFNRTLGNSSLRSSNPIIAAIQGSAADEIRRAHGESMAQMDQVIAQIRDFSPSLPQSPRAVPSPSSRSGSGHDDCALLDGAGRTDFAINEPDRFEALVRRCGAKTR